MRKRKTNSAGLFQFPNYIEHTETKITQSIIPKLTALNVKQQEFLTQIAELNLKKSQAEAKLQELEAKVAQNNNSRPPLVRIVTDFLSSLGSKDFIGSTKYRILLEDYNKAVRGIKLLNSEKKKLTELQRKLTPVVESYDSTIRNLTSGSDTLLMLVQKFNKILTSSTPNANDPRKLQAIQSLVAEQKTLLESLSPRVPLATSVVASLTLFSTSGRSIGTMELINDFVREVEKSVKISPRSADQQNIREAGFSR